jgi:hypothetical protein
MPPSIDCVLPQKTVLEIILLQLVLKNIGVTLLLVLLRGRACCSIVVNPEAFSPLTVNLQLSGHSARPSIQHTLRRTPTTCQCPISRELDRLHHPMPISKCKAGKRPYSFLYLYLFLKSILHRYNHKITDPQQLHTRADSDTYRCLITLRTAKPR